MIDLSDVLFGALMFAAGWRGRHGWDVHRVRQFLRDHPVPNDDGGER